MEKVVGTMPDYKLRLVLAEMKKGAMNNEVLQGLHIPTKLGMEVEVLLSIWYLRIMPIPVHQFPCGLTVYQSILKLFKDGETAVIGGPLKAFNSITKNFDQRDKIKHMVTLCTGLRSFKPKIYYFPSDKFSKIVADHADAEIPGIEMILKDDKVEEPKFPR